MRIDLRIRLVVFAELAISKRDVSGVRLDLLDQTERVNVGKLLFDDAFNVFFVVLLDHPESSFLRVFKREVLSCLLVFEHLLQVF